MFTFEEVKKCTNNFAETNEIGGGGYGLVITHSVPFGHFMNYNKMRAKGMVDSIVKHNNTIPLGSI